MIEPYAMSKKQLDEFQTSMKQVLSYIKVSREKEKLKKLIAKDKAFQEIEKEAAWVIETATNTKLHIEEKEGACVDMCQAMIDWEKEIREEEQQKMCQAMVDWEKEIREEEQKKLSQREEEIRKEEQKKLSREMVNREKMIREEEQKKLGREMANREKMIREEEQKKIVVNLYQLPMSPEQMAQVTGLSVEKIKEILHK